MSLSMNISKKTPSANRNVSSEILSDCRRRMASRRAVSRSSVSRIPLSDKQIRRNHYSALVASQIWREEGFAGLTEIHQQLERTESITEGQQFRHNREFGPEPPDETCCGCGKPCSPDIGVINDDGTEEWVCPECDAKWMQEA